MIYFKEIKTTEIKVLLSILLDIPEDMCEVKMPYTRKEYEYVTCLDYSPEEWDDIFQQKEKTPRDALSILCGFGKIFPGDYLVINDQQ